MAEAKKDTKAKKEAELKAKTAIEGSEPEVKLDKEAVNDEKPATAKAGKRSAKAKKEAEEKVTKEARKEAKEAEPKAKPAAKPPKTREERASKRYREAAKLVEKTKQYSLAEALNLAVKTASTKFDSTIELHINLGVDPKQADQNIRGTVVLPAGTGKTARIAVFADGDDTAKAKAAGADIAGADAVTALLEKENLDFDVLIATPKMMPELGKFARLLGPRGLMPNPKSGTVSADVTAAVSEAKAGKVEFRVDPAGIIHIGVGKASFGADKLVQNADAVISNVRQAKPASLKGIYVKSITVSSTMGPGIKVETGAKG